MIGELHERGEGEQKCEIFLTTQTPKTHFLPAALSLVGGCDALFRLVVISGLVESC